MFFFNVFRLIAEEYKAVKAAEQASQVIIAELKKDLEETKRGKVNFKLL